MVGGSTRGGDRNVTGGDRKTYERGYGFRRRGDRWLPDRWNPLGGFDTGTTAPPVSLNDGDPVSTWPDSSGNGHDATQTGTARPTFNTNQVNGKPAVLFLAGNSQNLGISTITTPTANTAFAVIKPVGGSGNTVHVLANSGANQSETMGYFYFNRVMVSANNFRNQYDVSSYFTGGYHVLTSEMVIATNATNLFVDGNSVPVFSTDGGQTAGGIYNSIGMGSGDFSNGWIAEIILYSGSVSIRAKLLVVLTVLLTTGEIPSPDEAEALLAAGDLVALEAYLIEHGVSVEQARDTLEPMAAGDRANIEKYLGTKYGLTVTSGGTAVDPSTVAGLVGWWKADSLAAATGPPPFDPTQVTGLQGWWKADSIAPVADATLITSWPDSSGKGRNATTALSGKTGPLYFSNVLAAVRDLDYASQRPQLPFDDDRGPVQTLVGKPVLLFNPGSGLVFSPQITLASPGYTAICVMWFNVGNPMVVLGGQTGAPVPEILDLGTGGFAYFSDANAYRYGVDLSTYAAGVWKVVSVTSNAAGTWNVYVGGVSQAVSPQQGWPSSAMCNIIGYRGDGGQDSNAYFAELLFYDSILSTTDRQNVENYLKAKYSL